jgi:hypothetical protein
MDEFIKEIIHKFIKYKGFGLTYEMKEIKRIWMNQETCDNWVLKKIRMDVKLVWSKLDNKIVIKYI